MNLKELSTVTISKNDIERMCTLPRPDRDSLSGAPRHVLAALDRLFELWVDILANGTTLPIDDFSYTCPHGHKISYEGADLRGRLVLTIGGYLECLYSMWLEEDRYRKSKFSPKAMNLSLFSKFMSLEIDRNDESEAGLRTLQLRILSHNYFIGMSSLFLSEMLISSAAPRALVGQIESMAHDKLLDIFENCFSVKGINERILARRLAKALFVLAKRAYSNPKTWNSDHRLGAFSAIRTEELALLARRDGSMQRIYGKKHVEKVFEQQLALILQSLGLYVVSTKTGQSTVDLLCISANPEDRITFLVEAKTSKASYSLPKKDQRALRDYVADTKRCLGTLPPLAFVLIVAGSHSKTLESKLASLESETSTPIRFLRAQQFADLREKMAGPLPIRIFLQEALSGPRVLDDSIVDRVTDAYSAEQNAHQSFVESMLAAKGITKSPEVWAAHEH